MRHVKRQSAQASSKDLRALLGQDHQRLDELFSDLLAAFQRDDRKEATALWRAFDSGLTAHMKLEEALILPAFANVAPAEAAALAREHVAFRASLTELGVGVDLHCTNAEAVERFLAALREHAEREDALMYRWAQANIPGEVRSAIRTQLLGAPSEQVITE